MARESVKTMYDRVRKALSPDKRESFEDDAAYWPLESMAYQITMWVNGNIKPDHESEESVAAYAVICGCTKAEMKQSFIANGD